VPVTTRLAALPRPLVLLLLAVALLLPVMLGPLRLNDSHWINYSWSQQFTAAILHGDPWPRWLAQSHGGLGAPNFYFYGPVAFWIAAAFGLLGLSPWPALLGAATLALWASGLAMLRYLDGWAKQPLLGAALYMALPYHLLDFAMRGAIAEFTAYAALPLVAVGIREQRLWLIAAAYALLVMTHLPTALLASLFLIPPLLLARGWHDRPALIRGIAGLLLGLMLAASYLLPAMLLQRFVAIATMTGVPALQASRWTILTGDPHLRNGMVLVTVIGAAVALPALVLLRRDRWGWFVPVIVSLALGLPPFLWSIPLLAHVQFPWRMLVLADFGLVVLVARSALPAARLLMLAVPALALSLVIISVPTSNQAAPPLDLLRARHPDVIEYLPVGTTERYAAYSHRALDLAARTPPARVANGWTTLRLHYFPIWQVRCGGVIAPTEAEPGTGLLRYRGAGCMLERHRPPSERIGIALAMVALALLGLNAFRRQLPSLFNLS
jgi:hypothetical protein